MRKKLATMKQTGSISGYVGAFRGLMVEMEDLAPPDAAAKFYFIEGCVPEIKKVLLYQDPADLEEAMRTAERVGSAET